LSRHPTTPFRNFEIARETGNDLIVQVKDNQPSLLRRLEDIAAKTAPVAINDSRNLARSRQEDRCVAVYRPGSALDETEWASLVAAIVRVERQTLIRSAATGQWTTRQETAFYASSVMLPAKTFASAIRNQRRTRTIGCATSPSPKTPAAYASTRASWRDCAVTRSTSPAPTA
jgi:hypothetical protein